MSMRLVGRWLVARRALMGGLFLGLIVASWVRCTPAAADEPVVRYSPEVEAHIQHIVAALIEPKLVAGKPASTVSLSDRMTQLHVPGVSIAFVHHGQIEWSRGFGAERVGGAPVTPDTLFQAGSISKPVTAMAVLSLAQSGRLDLDADVSRYLRSWKLPDSRYTETEKVTLRRLLTHTAGVTIHGFQGYAAGQSIPSLRQILDGSPPANSPPVGIDTTPGAAWRYSGGGYVIIQQVLEDVSGEPFAKLMDEVVLGPLGMNQSTFDQPLPQGELEKATTPYDDQGQPIKGGAHIYPEMAPAGLWTTPSDLARYIIELQNALSGKSSAVLSRATALKMVAPGGLGQWGLGFQLGGAPGSPAFGHEGGNAGFVSLFVAYEDGDAVVIMTNGSRGDALIQEVLRTIACEYRWPDFQPEP